MDYELDRFNQWDAQSCAEFEAWLDEVEWESREDERNDQLADALEEQAYNELHAAGRDAF